MVGLRMNRTSTQMNSSVPPCIRRYWSIKSICGQKTLISTLMQNLKFCPFYWLFCRFFIHERKISNSLNCLFGEVHFLTGTNLTLTHSFNIQGICLGLMLGLRTNDWSRRQRKGSEFLKDLQEGGEISEFLKTIHSSRYYNIFDKTVCTITC